MVDAPATELTEPVPYDPVPDLVENIIGASQYISVSYWTGWAIEQITGTDPFQFVVEQFTGDYEAVQRAGLALKNLAEFNALYKTAVDSAVSEVIPYDWRGNAADAAQNYFQTLADALGAQVAALEDVGDQFEQSAFGIYEAAQGFKGGLQSAVDWAIAAAVSAAAAAATSWTGAGALAGGAATAAAILKGTSAWRTALTYHTHAWNASQAFAGVVAGYLSALDGLEQVPLPEGSYHHSEVSS